MPLQQLLLIGFGIIALVVLIRFYHVIFLGFARLLFGNYSSRYFAIYKRLTKRNPHRYCIKDEFINYIAGFYKDQDRIKKFSTDSEIKFQECDFGTHFRKVLSLSKKPFCVNSQRMELFDLKVIGFKDALFTMEMKEFYFFIDGKFFLGQLIFKNPDKENIAKIIGIISKKYLLDQSANLDKFIIDGSNGTHLYCTYNGFYLSISYLSRANPHVNNLIDEYWGNSTHIELGKKTTMEEELLEKI